MQSDIFLVPFSSQVMYKLPYNIRPVVGNLLFVPEIKTSRLPYKKIENKA